MLNNEELKEIILVNKNKYIEKDKEEKLKKSNKDNIINEDVKYNSQTCKTEGENREIITEIKKKKNKKINLLNSGKIGIDNDIKKDCCAEKNIPNSIFKNSKQLTLDDIKKFTEHEVIKDSIK